MTRLLPILLLVPLVGCPEPPDLRPAPVTPVDAVLTPSVWDGVDGGELPDLLFAVAWHPLEASCSDCDDPQWRSAPLRYSVVDSRGTVRADFPLPWTDELIDHLDLQAAGPGALLATISRADHTASGPDGYLWRTLRLDASDGSVTEVLRLQDAGLIELPASGLSLEHLEPSRSVRVTADPAQPSRIWFLPDRTDPDGDPRLGRLYSADLFDPEVAPRSWSGEELLNEPLVHADGGAPLQPWTLQAAEVDGQTTLLVGIDGEGPSGFRRSLGSWSAEDESPSSALDLTEHGDLAIRSEPSYLAGPDGGAALFQRGSVSSFCGEPSFVVVSAAGALPVEAGDGADCGWAGPLLDADAPTFAWFGFSLDAQGEPGHQLQISHRGQDVWSVDRFADGIDERPFLLLEAVLLQAD